MSSFERERRQSRERPTLPPIRDLFHGQSGRPQLFHSLTVIALEELSHSPRTLHESPALTLARLSVSDNDDIPPRLHNLSSSRALPSTRVRQPNESHAAELN